MNEDDTKAPTGAATTSDCLTTDATVVVAEEAPDTAPLPTDITLPQPAVQADDAGETAVPTADAATVEHEEITIPPQPEENETTATCGEPAEYIHEPIQPDFVWHLGRPPGPQTRAFCEVLGNTGLLYGTPEGKVLRLKEGEPVREIKDAVDFEAFIRANLLVRVIDDRGPKGFEIPSKHLRILLRSSELQSSLPQVDFVTEKPTYTSVWSLTKPGYNDGAAGDRIYYTGKAVVPKPGAECIRTFLNVMSFKTNSDKTNSVGLALTVLLRRMWPGGKPFGAVTANKSHAGKDTVIDFAVGKAGKQEISWHEKDWATQNEAAAVLADFDIGVLVLGNVRSSSGGIIESAFIERTVTSPKSKIQSSKRSGDGYSRNGDFVVMASANNGKFSTDLANRSLPIHLEQIGDITKRELPIGFGSPRGKFLPEHQDEIEAELCGLIEEWKKADSPLDESVQFPMDAWAKTVGGILKANGFEGFLGNFSLQRSVSDPIREALGLLANSLPRGEWLNHETIMSAVKSEGLLNTLTQPQHRGSSSSIKRQLGKVLSSHEKDTVNYEEEDDKHSYKIKKWRRTDPETLKKTVFYMFEEVLEESKKE